MDDYSYEYIEIENSIAYILSWIGCDWLRINRLSSLSQVFVPYISKIQQLNLHSNSIQWPGENVDNPLVNQNCYFSSLSIGHLDLLNYVARL